jgi:hypothetical protein
MRRQRHAQAEACAGRGMRRQRHAQAGRQADRKRIFVSLFGGSVWLGGGLAGWVLFPCSLRVSALGSVVLTLRVSCFQRCFLRFNASRILFLSALSFLASRLLA